MGLVAPGPATKKTEPEAKKDALATALAQIEKQFGKGAVMKLGDNASCRCLFPFPLSFPSKKPALA